KVRETASKAREGRSSGRLGASMGRDGAPNGRDGVSKGRDGASKGRDALSMGRWPGISFKSPKRSAEPNAGLAATRRLPFAGVRRVLPSWSAAAAPVAE